MIDTSPINIDVELFKKRFKAIWHQYWPYNEVTYFEQPGENLLRISIDYAERGRSARMEYTVDLRFLRTALQNCQQADYIRSIVRELSDKIVRYSLTSDKKRNGGTES